MIVEFGVISYDGILSVQKLSIPASKEQKIINSDNIFYEFSIFLRSKIVNKGNHSSWKHEFVDNCNNTFCIFYYTKGKNIQNDNYNLKEDILCDDICILLLNKKINSSNENDIKNFVTKFTLNNIQNINLKVFNSIYDNIKIDEKDESDDENKINVKENKSSNCENKKKRPKKEEDDNFDNIYNEDDDDDEQEDDDILEQENDEIICYEDDLNEDEENDIFLSKKENEDIDSAEELFSDTLLHYEPYVYDDKNISWNYPIT